MKKIITFIHGFCMALADSVPGVSGGTIAFLLGFYDRFVDSLDDLISGTKEKRIAALKYLIKLGIGWAYTFSIQWVKADPCACLRVIVPQYASDITATGR